MYWILTTFVFCVALAARAAARPEAEQYFLDALHVNEDILGKHCRSFSRTREDREDLHQEIVHNLWKSFSSFTGQSSIRTWIYRVALNTALQRVKSEKVKLDYMSSLPARLHPVGEQVHDDIDGLFLELHKLDPLDRGIVLMVMDDYSHEEIGDILGMQTKSVTIRLRRLRIKLKNQNNLLWTSKK